jgi:hypothetical protein
VPEPRGDVAAGRDLEVEGEIERDRADASGERALNHQPIEAPALAELRDAEPMRDEPRVERPRPIAARALDTTSNATTLRNHDPDATCREARVKMHVMTRTSDAKPKRGIKSPVVTRPRKRSKPRPIGPPLGPRLRELIELLGVTQDEFSTASGGEDEGLPRTEINKACNGKNEGETLRWPLCIARAAGTSIADTVLWRIGRLTTVELLDRRGSAKQETDPISTTSSAELRTYAKRHRTAVSNATYAFVRQEEKDLAEAKEAPLTADEVGTLAIDLEKARQAYRAARKAAPSATSEPKAPPS